MWTARRIFLPIVVAMVGVLLAGCPSLGPLSTTPPSVDRAQNQAREGDHAGAASTYEALALQNSGTERNGFLLLAVREFILARRSEDAARVFASVAPPLTPDQSFERQLLSVELALARSQAPQAWQQLALIPEPKTAPAAGRYLELKERTAFATGRVADAIRAEIARERWLASSAERNTARRELLGLLRESSERGVKIDPRSAADHVVRGWLELAGLAAAAARNPSTATADIVKPGAPGIPVIPRTRRCGGNCWVLTPPRWRVFRTWRCCCP